MPSVMSRPLPTTNPGRLLDSVRPLERGEFLALLLLLGFGSAITDRVIISLNAGFATAFAGTFDISAVVWGAAWIGTGMLLEAGSGRVRRSDWLVALAAIPAILAPFQLINWIALTCLAGYVVATAEKGGGARRGGYIFLALTFPMFWSPRIFGLFSEQVLSADAVLVSWIVGTERVGNTIPFPDRPGFIYIAPGCSSLANISLAVLCWVVFAQMSRRAATLRDVGWCLAACTGVVAINVARMGLIGLYPDHYDAIHNYPGALVAGYATLALMLGVCAVWKRRELFGVS